MNKELLAKIKNSDIDKVEEFFVQEIMMLSHKRKTCEGNISQLNTQKANAEERFDQRLIFARKKHEDSFHKAYIELSNGNKEVDPDEYWIKIEKLEYIVSSLEEEKKLSSDKIDLEIQKEKDKISLIEKRLSRIS